MRHINDRATTGLRGNIVEFERETKCVACGVHVFTTYSVPDFKVSKRRYDYPAHYRVKGGYPVFDARTDYIKVRFGKEAS